MRRLTTHRRATVRLTDGRLTDGAAPARRTALVVAAALAAAAAACSPDRLLDVQDPDIVSPTGLASPAGADALRVGALFQVNKATGGNDQVDVSTGGVDTMVLLSDLLADVWRSGDTFNERDETDRRSPQDQNLNVEGAYRALQRARVAAQIAILAARAYNPDAPAWHVPQMYWVQAYVETLVAEYFCGAAPMSEASLDGSVASGSSLTTDELLARALAHADSGLALLGDGSGFDEDRVRSSLAVTKGRLLVDLARYADAAEAVADVPTDFAFRAEFNQTATFNQLWDFNLNQRRYTISAGEGGVGLDFTRLDAGTAGVDDADPRVPRCLGGSDECDEAGVGTTTIFDSQNAAVIPLWVQLRYPARDTPWPYVTGTEARLIEAEARLAAGGDWLGVLNALRAGTAGLAPLADPGDAAARQDLLFRERALWLFGTGHRLGDLRRLVRQYARPADAVFPSGAYVKGGDYGAAVNFPVPQAEENNPGFSRAACVTTQP